MKKAPFNIFLLHYCIVFKSSAINGSMRNTEKMHGMNYGFQAFCTLNIKFLKNIFYKFGTVIAVGFSMGYMYGRQ